MSLVQRIFVSGAIAFTPFLQAFELTSNDIQEGQQLSSAFVFNGFGCSGENHSPQLSWSNAPKGTKSFAVTVYDPDAPSVSGWWHWNIVDIPASTTNIKQGQSTESLKATAITNDFGTKAFGGACPPKGHGMHRYQFTVWALPYEKMSLPENPQAALVGYMLNQDTLGMARITATYSR
ncbi:YbhB/YbcL family Raf kinase inhibitor-like protein [Vibrio sp.]|uniref:YbhB/YbcL family Raf kinase inhibitor-like protein n=1 Tax=Vibrio viridaestus TaxID=2487322 RepID=A0A3N9U3C5_9VIBR|nr:YbhB/YbcL family Raf kinase inhibitor-like protein [Vibrio viridaestus]MDC0611066.1 YbhB/YbcL family Raf kinase inhibitor-like protein [Vibrio sp.]RQW64082.1 YbhB/YbcL family Raf kinase inhibitor-like protein [Vibrio viridaestus]